MSFTECSRAGVTLDGTNVLSSIDAFYTLSSLSLFDSNYDSSNNLVELPFPKNLRRLQQQKHIRITVSTIMSRKTAAPMQIYISVILLSLSFAYEETFEGDADDVVTY